jgi:hypothetical protein
MRTLRPRIVFFVLALLLFRPGTSSAQSGTLDIYWIDVEGGAATLVVSPSGESLLYDAGWETDGRDGKRIAAVVQQAGLKRSIISSSVITTRIMPAEFRCCRSRSYRPMLRPRRFCRAGEQEVARHLFCRVQGQANEREDRRHDSAQGRACRCRASNGQMLAKPLAGGGPNPLCASAENKPPEGPENQHMIGSLFTFGRFTFLDLADLDWQKEMELACPVNRLGHVTVWQAGRHGALDGAGRRRFFTRSRHRWSSSQWPAKGLAGRQRRLAEAFDQAYDRIASTPGIQGIWQGHLSLLDSDKASNTAPDQIANFEESAECKGN